MNSSIHGSIFCRVAILIMVSALWPSMAVAGTEITRLHEFPVPPKSPMVGLVLGGDGKYWGTSYGGGKDGKGTVFRVDPSNGSVSKVVEFSGGDLPLSGPPSGGLVADDSGYLWGSTARAIFKIHAATGLLEVVTEVPRFPDDVSLATPAAALTYDGSGFYWSTSCYSGIGNAGNGTVFKIEASSGAYTRVLAFTGSAGLYRGRNAQTNLVSDGQGFMWGTTRYGGQHDKGTVFKIHITSGAMTTLVDFTETGALFAGGLPTSGLVPTGDGYLWGSTWSGGANGYGTIYRMNILSGVHETVYSFLKNCSGDKPQLTADSSGNLWGTALWAISGYGSIFKINTNTRVVEVPVLFSGAGTVNAGRLPSGKLLRASDGKFWGVTNVGGDGDYGTIYQLDPLSAQLLTKSHLTSGTGHNPNGAMCADSAGMLWGTPNMADISIWGPFTS